MRRVLMGAALVMGCGRTELIVEEPFAGSVPGSDTAVDAPEVARIDSFVEDVPREAEPPVRAPSVIALGYQHACALAGSRVRCWGANGKGQLGDGTTTDRTTPTTLASFGDVVEIAAGGNVTCAVTAEGSLHCWGDPAHGQVGGLASPGFVATPMRSSLGAVASVAVGGEHVCATLRDGTVWCWGTTTYGAPGHTDGATCGGGTTCDPVPRQIEGLSGVVKVAAGYQHSCALTADARVWCWGRNQAGQLGDGTIDSRPTPAPIGSLRARSLSLGQLHSCAAVDDESIECWGSNVLGKLGFGEAPGGDDNPCMRVDLLPQFSLVPHPVEELGRARAVAAGLNHTCALRSDGSVSCWGVNNRGELGDHVSTSMGEPCSSKPRPTGLSGVIAIASGNAFSCAVTSTGTLFCWGMNLFGEIGDGTNYDRFTPVPVKW